MKAKKRRKAKVLNIFTETLPVFKPGWPQGATADFSAARMQKCMYYIYVECMHAHAHVHAR